MPGRCLLLLSMVSLIGCRQEPRGHSGALDSLDVGRRSDRSASSIFAPDTLAPGDTLLGFRVNDVAFRRAFADSVWVGSALFEGEVAVSGHYAAHFDCPSIPEACIPCFYADSVSTGRLPRLRDDERYAWFCFTNATDVEGILGKAPVRGTEGGRRADVVISRYRYVFSFSDVYNEAEFVREIPSRRGRRD